MHRIVMLSALVLVALFACGCFETKQEFFVNPDGSGKVVIENVFQPIDMTGTGKQDPEAEMKKAVKDVLENSKGVEVWKDVSFSRAKDGRVVFKGTAYFRDISRFDVQNAGIIKVTLSKDAGGNLVIQTKSDKPAAAGTVKLTDEEVKSKIEEQKTEYQRNRGMMAGMMSSLRMNGTFHLPGSVTDVSNFKKTADGALQIDIEGTKLLEAMDGIMKDDSAMRELVSSGGDLTESGPMDSLIFNEKLFGQKAPVRAVIGADAKPLFDYEAEVAAARAGFADMVKALDIKVAEPAPPAKKGEPLKNVRVGGVRIVRIEDQEREVRPFYQGRGLTMSIVADFPGAVLKVPGGRVDKAVADNGQDILPADEWARNIGFCALSKDGTTAIFDANLTLPGDGVKYVQEISGVLECIVAGGVKKADLGLMDFAAGAKGAALGASITDVKADSWTEGAKIVSLTMAVAQESVKSVTFFDESGKELAASSRGYSSSGESTAFEYSIEGGLPAKGRIVVEVYEIEKFEMVFKVERVDLLGLPVK
jgi:hypothetical protein